MSAAARRRGAGIAQRVSAMVLAVCVVVHLATHHLRGARRPHRGRDPRAHARQLGLRPSSTRVFVIACAVHVPIGLRNVAREWLRPRRARRPLARPRLRRARCSCWACARSSRWWHETAQRRARARPPGVLGVPRAPPVRASRWPLFLPLHFWALGRALQGEAALDDFLRWTDSRCSSSPSGAWWCCWRRTSPAACACC